MKAAKIILIALFYAGILYSLFSSIYVHGEATRVLDKASDLLGDTYSDEYKKLDKALRKGICLTLIGGVIVSVLFYYAGIFDL
jgi:hypothetical protein